MKQTQIILIVVLMLFAGTMMASAKADSSKMKSHNMHKMMEDSSKMKSHGMHKMMQDSSKKKSGEMKGMMGDKMGMKEAKIWNAYCPVKGGEVDPATPTMQYKGKTIGFCCPGCDAKFMKNPEKYIKNISEDGKKYVGKKAEKMK